jgi:hypothetical protein
MNWTGGRLRRQSGNRPDSISKIQKQHFARARIKQQESRQKARIILIEKPEFVFGASESNESSRFVVNSQSTQSAGRAERFSGGLSRQSQGNLPDGEYFGAGNNNLEVHSLTHSHKALLTFLSVLRQILASPMSTSSKSTFLTRKTG